jgi:exodeoxyribonuclease VII large subunit
METSLEQPAPVRQVANAISGWVDRLGAVWVEGQIAQFNRRQGMNTVFLTLRDTVADISISLTCSRQVFDSLNPPMVEGASVVVHAKPSFYANRGTLSLHVRDIRMVGLGELLARIERRRQLLAAEGLFAVERKRRLPFLPGTVGLVTAPSSAAERDVLENGRRRWPAVRFAVRYAAMQGTTSAAEVIAALERLDRDPVVDVIVIARGGGSVEDLLPFSDEGLLRAVFAARTPVVSAIGHEPDSPLLDLVADLRASTPTDAAKLVVSSRRRPESASCASGVARCSARGWPASSTRSTPCGPARRSLTRAAASRTVGARCWPCGSGPVAPCTISSTAPATTWATSWPGSAACRRWPPSSAAMPSCRTPTGTS